MAQRTFHETGQDGRSVLGMLAVQVERDPKTGATVVRSVAPVSTPTSGPQATTIFDDGRKSIHTFGGSPGQPSSEELGQILSAIDGVGLKVLLDEASVVPKTPETKTHSVEAGRAPEEIILTSTSHYAVSKDDGLLDGFRSSPSEVTVEKCAVSVGNTDDKTMQAVPDVAENVDEIDAERLEDGPVTLMFLGYADASTDQDDQDGMITVERVIITEDGEEHVVGPETPASLQSPLGQVVEREDGKDPGAFQDIPLNESAVKAQGAEGDNGQHNTSSPTTEKEKGKRKTCQCCSVM
ncbi:uncharacterized protein LOC124998366 [Mugil cephalus]|uniref:uncharacterized protein LOC124998366 n=1 Tax=Mugil cephalus TaxID=48193 RepID=UPI001FB6A4D8|nr:uncharacterized protein LOC124998366 [Mugil cephalus]XP_047428671.1 uncharacterized protein LOC124998366 [Mugil cephalus]